MATISTSTRPAAPVSPATNGQTYRGPFAIMTLLFFMWGFITVWNDILIPRFKEAFTLNYFQAMLVQFAFFGAYSIGGLIYYLVSKASGDPINKIGYKNGVIIGLLISAVGCTLFYPAAIGISYPFFLLALFVVGLGLAMLQIAANPYVTILGPERTASSRLNLSQAFNSFGTTIGPIIGGFLVFTYFTHKDAHGADSVKIPYLGFAAAFVLLAVFFKFAHVPSFTNTDQIPPGAGALKHPHTALGMLAIFMYVGGEVTVGSAIVNFLGTERLGGIPRETASSYLAFYWGGLMIGRFMGAFALSDMRKSLKRTLVILVPVAAFVTILALPAIGKALNQDWTRATELCSLANAMHYGVFLVILLVAFFLGESSPHRMLALFCGVIIVLLITGMTTAGETAKWAILGIGLFCSVMWSNIFSLAIEGLGPLKSQASSLLVLAILGGALLPPVQGAVADWIGIQYSFVVPVFAFAYIAFYGLYGYRAGRATAPSGSTEHISRRKMKYILKKPNGDQTTLTRDGLANRLGNGVVHEDWLVRPEDGTDWVTVAELLASAPSPGELAQAKEEAARTGPPEGSPTPSAERLGSPQSGGMDFQKLAKLILVFVFGAVVLCVGAFQALSNQPLPEPPPDDGKFKGWNDFMNKTLDPTKNGLGVAVLNIDRANARAQGYKVMGFGAIVVFVGVAIGRSAKPSRS